MNRSVFFSEDVEDKLGNMGIYGSWGSWAIRWVRLRSDRGDGSGKYLFVKGHDREEERVDFWVNHGSAMGTTTL